MSVYIGFDPGANGAMAILYDDNSFSIEDFDKAGIDGYVASLRVVKEMGEPIYAGIEWAAAMPKQGVTSMFNFGQRFGEIQGILAGLEIGFTMMRPRKWQSVCGIKPKTGKAGIEKAMKKIYPKADFRGPKGGLKDGRCDAMGVATYIRMTF